MTQGSYKQRLLRATACLSLGTVAITGISATSSIVAAPASSVSISSTASVSGSPASAPADVTRGAAPSAGIAAESGTDAATKRGAAIREAIKRAGAWVWNQAVAAAKKSWNALVGWWNGLASWVRWVITLAGQVSAEEVLRAVWDAVH